jgi:predicted ATPase
MRAWDARSARSLPLAGLDDRLDQRFRLLTSAEQVLLERLSAFPAVFDLGAALPGPATTRASPHSRRSRSSGTSAHHA